MSRFICADAYPIIHRAHGIGLSIAKRLSSRADWTIHIIDINEEGGKEVANDLPRTTFHHANVTNYKRLSTAFQNAFQAQGQLDFIFANAGFFERGSFYSPQPAEGEAVSPPPEPEMITIDLSLKDGALGLMRNIAKPFRADGIRVNAICPGVTRTSLIDDQVLDRFPQIFVELERVSETVVQLVDGGEKGQGMTDAWGTHVPSAKMFGLAVEISDNGNRYFRDQHDFADEGMKTVFGSVDLSGNMENILKDEANSIA
ncbi:unnamed protein product [Penicillium pancosmium]